MTFMIGTDCSSEILVILFISFGFSLSTVLLLFFSNDSKGCFSLCTCFPLWDVSFDLVFIVKWKLIEFFVLLLVLITVFL